MFTQLQHTVELLQNAEITEERKAILRPLAEFIQNKITDKKLINLHFICTHNSRRSQLSQIWAQMAAAYFNIPGIACYSGGTEETSIFPAILHVLDEQGFFIQKISDSKNPVYAIRYDENSLPIIGFSKKYNDPFNPANGFAAVMTCTQADGECPLIFGAEVRIPITYEDPKISDHTSQQTITYKERSLQIGAEMFYTFSLISQ